MSNKSIYFIFLIVLGSTFGIWVPILFAPFELDSFNLSISMYAVPMILSCCSEPLIVQEANKRKRIIYVSAIVLVFFVCLVHIALITRNFPVLSTIISAFVIVGVLWFYWYQCDSSKLENNNSAPMGGQIDN